MKYAVNATQLLHAHYKDGEEGARTSAEKASKTLLTLLRFFSPLLSPKMAFFDSAASVIFMESRASCAAIFSRSSVSWFSRLASST